MGNKWCVQAVVCCSLVDVLLVLLGRSASARAAGVEQGAADLEVRKQQLAAQRNALEARESALVERESALARALWRLEQRQETHAREQATLQAHQVRSSTLDITHALVQAVGNSSSASGIGCIPAH